MVFEFILRKEGSLGSFSDEEFTNNKQFVDLSFEASSTIVRRFSDGLHQTGVGILVVHLNRFDLSRVKQKLDIIITLCIFGEASLVDEVVGGLVLIILEIISKNQVH